MGWARPLHSVHLKSAVLIVQLERTLHYGQFKSAVSSVQWEGTLHSSLQGRSQVEVSHLARHATPGFVTTLDTWLLTLDSWHLTIDTWLLTLDSWHLTLDTWILTLDSWHLTLDTWPLTPLLTVQRDGTLHYCLQGRSQVEVSDRNRHLTPVEFGKVYIFSLFSYVHILKY